LRSLRVWKEFAVDISPLEKKVIVLQVELASGGHAD
jgi:hypothetical protein